MSICVICTEALIVHNDTQSSSGDSEDQSLPSTTSTSSRRRTSRPTRQTHTDAWFNTNHGGRHPTENSVRDEEFARDNSVVRLDCGHSFHCKCAIQWFRYNHACCPLCRATHIETSWKIKTPAQRVAIMRRGICKLPKFIQARVRKCDSIATKLATSVSELRDFRRAYSALLKKERAMERSIRMLSHKKKKLVRELAWFSAPDVPYLHVPSTTQSMNVDDDDSDDSGNSDGDENESRNSTRNNYVIDESSSSTLLDGDSL